MNEKIKSILMRLLKGAVSGAVSTILLLTFTVPTNWLELKNFIALVTIAGIFGAINGVLLALQKWYSWKE
jgi:hypothetical protein